MDVIQVNDSRILKGYRYIKAKFGFDSHESVQIAPFGDDSCPIKGVKAIKTKTSTNSIQVIVGYFNRTPKALEGEKRLYSVKPDESEGFYIYFKNDGTCEVGGNTDWMVRFSELKKGFDKLVEAHNGLVDKYNQHTHVCATPGLPSAITNKIEIASQASIDNSKIEQIKTI